jgi:hypothetical protein
MKWFVEFVSGTIEVDAETPEEAQEKARADDRAKYPKILIHNVEELRDARS